MELIYNSVFDKNVCSSLVFPIVPRICCVIITVLSVIAFVTVS